LVGGGDLLHGHSFGLVVKAGHNFFLKKIGIISILNRKEWEFVSKGENGMKRFFLIYFPLLLFVSTFLLSGTSIHAAQETTVEEIMADKDSYDGKEVSLSGAVSTPRFRASRQKKPYMTFPLLGDSGSRINILYWGDIKLKTGRKIKVQGIYRKTMEMGKYTFRDVIEATEIEKEKETQEKTRWEMGGDRISSVLGDQRVL
jgi:hypothetical protein